MENLNRKKHWENIYQTKELPEVSWYQPTPQTSLDFFIKNNIPLTAKIIDIGGGDSFLVDHLLELGYQNITVLDISENAIRKAKKRLGEKAEKITWIVSDIFEFSPIDHYDVWHDRAAFHFLTNPSEINHYIKIAHSSLNSGGKIFIGTFSDNGPKKCSGIEISQYDANALSTLFQNSFSIENCFTVDHQTPFNTIQNFTFCSFHKK